MRAELKKNVNCIIFKTGMISYPNAKLNIGLDILRRREDGYHDIDTLMVPCFGLRDVLEIVPSSALEMHLYGIPLDGNGGDNLCMKAYRLLWDRYGLPPVEIHLYKGIPSGAGLGGGSADAAFTLRMLNEMFALRLPDATLAELAAQLGSDCPFFICNRPMLCRGRGEIMTEFGSLPEGLRFEVEIPPVHVSTREAYAGVSPAVPEIPLEELLRLPVPEWRGKVRNAFEDSVFPAHPEIAAAKEAMYSRGALYASMSGSGSSVFGIFRDPAK